MWSAPDVHHATHSTFDPTARASRCASELNSTTETQKLLINGFNNLDGIDMGHKGHFLRLLLLMSYKNKQRQWWTLLHVTAWSSHHGGDIFHTFCTFIISQIHYKLSKIAILGCKKSFKYRSEHFQLLELGGAAPFASFRGQRSNASRYGQWEHFT